MNHGLSDQVRAVALKNYVHPAILAGREQFSIAVRDIMQFLKAESFPAKNWPQVCTALQTEKFLRTNGLEIESVDGPPSKMSTTVVVRYRVASRSGESEVTRKSPEKGKAMLQNEDPSDRALRLAAKLRGLLKDEYAEYGGGEAFLRWMRSEDEDAA